MSDNKPRLTWQRLSSEIGFSRQAINEWRKLPNAPKTPDSALWLSFIAENNLGKSITRTLQEIKTEIAKQQLKKIERENALADGQLVSEGDVVDFLKGWAAKLDLLLTSELETNLPPRLQGLPIAEIRAEMRATHDRIREATNRGLLSWSPRTE